MTHESHVHRIHRTLATMPDNNIFCIGDLAKDCSSYDSIRRVLCDMGARDEVERIITGVYRIQRANQPDPDPVPVIHALARNNGWAVAPETEQARYDLGLTDQVPETVRYFCNGSGGSYLYNNKVLFVLCRNTSSYMTTLSLPARVVVSAFLDLRRHPVSAGELHKLQETLSDEIKQELLVKRIAIPARIRPVIEIICGQYGAVAK